jgi:hypothetical protein
LPGNNKEMATASRRTSVLVKRVIAGTSLASIAGVAMLMTVSVHSVEPHRLSLMAADIEERNAQYDDLEEKQRPYVVGKLWEMNINSKEESIDRYANKFFSTWAFNIESRAKNSKGNYDEIPQSFEVGKSFDLLTVTKRNDTNKEILLRWASTSSPICGSLYLRVLRLNDKQKVIQYGTVIQLPCDQGPDLTLFMYHINNRACILASSLHM